MKRLTGYMAGVNFGGWISQYKGNLARNPEHHFDTFVTEKDIAQIASWGMDHVRLPFDYSLIEWNEEKGEYGQLGFSYMDKCVSWCRKYGLNVVFDLHQAPGYSFDTPDDNKLFDDPEKQDRLADLWKYIAKRYRGEGQNIMYELLNEIVELTPDRWNALSGRLVDAIREVDTEHYIVIGGIEYNSPWRMKDLPLFDDDKIVYNFHMYSPMPLTHLRAGWVADMADYTGPDFFYPSPMKPYREYSDQLVETIWQPRHDNDICHKYTAMDACYIADFLRGVDDFMAEHEDALLYCGEYGVIQNADLESRINWTKDVGDYCVQRGIGRATWTYRGGFSMVGPDGKAIDDGLIYAASFH